MGVILIAILIGANGVPTSFTQQFESQAACEKAKEHIRETTKLRVDVLTCYVAK